MTTTNHMPAYQRERQRVRDMILAQHQTKDGELDRPSLIRHAIETRREVERLEAIINAGHVTEEQRDELTQAQWWDMHLQSTVRREIPEWSGAIANARTGFSKVMTKAARSLNILER